MWTVNSLNINLPIVEKTFNKPSLCIVMLVAEKRRRKKPREKLKNYENKATCLFIHVWCRIIRMTLPSGHHCRIHSDTLLGLLSSSILIFRLKIEIQMDSIHVMLFAEKRRRKTPGKNLKNYEIKATCLFVHV